MNLPIKTTGIKVAQSTPMFKNPMKPIVKRNVRAEQDNMMADANHIRQGREEATRRSKMKSFGGKGWGGP